jgi:hypothetical protein
VLLLCPSEMETPGDGRIVTVFFSPLDRALLLPKMDHGFIFSANLLFPLLQEYFIPMMA